MADVDTSIYKTAPADPLKTAGGAVNLLNSIQQGRLLQQAETIRNFDLGKAQMDTLVGTLGPLATQDNVSKATALGTAASVVRGLGIPPHLAGNILGPLMSAPDDPKSVKAALGAMFSRMAGTASGQPVTGPVTSTGAPQITPLGKAAGQGTVPTGLGPAATAAETASGGAAGAAAGNASAAEINYRRRVNPLEQAIPILDRIGPTGAGPSSNEINTMKSLATSLGITAKWTGTVKDYDEAKKYLVDYARQRGGSGTNDQLAASFSANPNVEKMSQAASVDVAKTLVALERMQFMQQQAWFASGKPANEFPKFASQWNAAHDPRAFGWDHMTAEQRQRVWNSLPAKKRDQFKIDVQQAKDAGVLNRMQLNMQPDAK